MIQNKMHKNGQILTINGCKYRIVKIAENNKLVDCSTCYCYCYCSNDCIYKIGLLCTRTIPLNSVLKRVNNDHKN